MTRSVYFVYIVDSVKSARDESAFRVYPYGKLQNTKELTGCLPLGGREGVHGFLRELGGSLKHIQCLLGMKTSRYVNPHIFARKGNGFLTPPFHTPLSFYMRSDTSRFELATLFYSYTKYRGLRIFLNSNLHMKIKQ